MAMNECRLVRRIQRGQQAQAPGVAADPVGARDVAELESRVHRLRAMSERFAHVRLSKYVALSGAADWPVHKGAPCVATEA